MPAERNRGLRVGRPTCEEVELLLGRAACLGRVGDDGQSLTSEFEGVTSQFDLADEGVAEVLVRATVETNVVTTPLGREGGAPGGEIADEPAETCLTRTSADLDPESRDDVVGNRVPIHEKGSRPGVEKDEPREVEGDGVRRQHAGVEGEAEPIGGDDVELAVADVGGRARHHVEEAGDAGAYGGAEGAVGRSPAGALGGHGGTGEVEQVKALCLVELKSVGDGVEDRLGDPLKRVQGGRLLMRQGWPCRRRS